MNKVIDYHKKKLPFISIIISVYNEEKTLRQCLDSLLGLEYPSYEVIMVNDASKDNTLAILQEYQQKNKAAKEKIKIVTYSINKGVPGARNEGMKAAKGEMFVFTDADATFPKEWPLKLIEPFLENPKIGATGGRDIAPPNQPLIERCIDYTLTSFIGTGGLRGAKVRLAKYAVTGCNFAVRREVVQKVGMHNEKIRWRGEEKEWCQRIREAGYDIIFAPESYILHYRRISLRSFWTQTYKSGKARFDILKVAPKSFAFIHIVPSLFILYLLITAIFSFVFPIAVILFSAAAIIYLKVLVLQSILGTFKTKNIASLLIVPITTVTMHFAYGLGFIRKFLHD
ncbi:MAG: glycosyltransferase [Nanoarchaeota archaeon]